MTGIPVLTEAPPALLLSPFASGYVFKSDVIIIFFFLFSGTHLQEDCADAGESGAAGEAGHLVVLMRKQGQVEAYSFRLRDPGEEETKPDLGQAVLLDLGNLAQEHSLRLGSQGPFDSDIVRLSFSSLRQPRVTLDYNLVTGRSSLSASPGSSPPPPRFIGTRACLLSSSRPFSWVGLLGLVC